MLETKYIDPKGIKYSQFTHSNARKYQQSLSIYIPQAALRCLEIIQIMRK